MEQGSGMLHVTKTIGQCSLSPGADRLFEERKVDASGPTAHAAQSAPEGPDETTNEDVRFFQVGTLAGYVEGTSLAGGTHPWKSRTAC